MLSAGQSHWLWSSPRWVGEGCFKPGVVFSHGLAEFWRNLHFHALRRFRLSPAKTHQAGPTVLHHLSCPGFLSDLAVVFSLHVPLKS